MTNTMRPTLWRTCRVIAGTTRLRLLWKIFQSDGLCVEELARATGATRENATIQLRALNARGLITPMRVGKKVIYRAEANHNVDYADDLLEALRQSCMQKVPIKEVFRQATAFTQNRRIALMRALAGGQDFDELLELTGMSSSALKWNLSKLESRGFVKVRNRRYVPGRPKNPLGSCLMNLVLIDPQS